VVSQRIADRDHRGGLDRLLEPSPPRCSHTATRAVAKLGDRHGGEEQLIASEALDRFIEVSAASPAQRGAEHAGIDDQPHDRIAAANTSSSSWDSSSINNASAEASTGAAINCSAVRSRGNCVAPCGASP
jgi:hypothetical protein